MNKILFLLLLSSTNVFSQAIDNLWLMGYDSWGGRPWGGINMDFTDSILDTGYVSRKMNFAEANGEICDKNGNLLFYTNGVWIANINNDTMVNGGGLNPSAYTTEFGDSNGIALPQANLIIPFPDDSTKYYLFHETDDDGHRSNVTLYLYYSIIDMTLDSGRGAVTQKNVILLTDSSVGGRLTACKHANGRDWWLTTHEYNSNKYYKYLISPSGISLPDTQNIGVSRNLDFGQIKFSPDGHKAAYYDPSGDLDIMDFDRCTGILSNLIHININGMPYSGGGAAFSPNSQVLYISANKYVYQFNLNAPNIDSSRITVAVFDSFASPQYFYTTFNLSELAPDGKIYINCGSGTNYIHVINYPDSLGLACNLIQHGIKLPAYNAFTIANHPNYFLGADSGSVCDSLTTAVQNSFPHVRDSKLEVYPNPITNEEVTFTYNVSSEAGVISIYNVEGEEVATYHLPQWSSVQHLKLPKSASGVYLARLRQGEVVSDVKFVKE